METQCDGRATPADRRASPGGPNRTQTVNQHLSHLLVPLGLARGRDLQAVFAHRQAPIADISHIRLRASKEPTILDEANDTVAPERCQNSIAPLQYLLMWPVSDPLLGRAPPNTLRPPPTPLGTHLSQLPELPETDHRVFDTGPGGTD